MNHPLPAGAGGRRRPAQACVRAASLLLALGATVVPLRLQAQTWSTEANVRVGMAATTNGALAPSGEERKDLVTSVEPSFTLSAEGIRFRLKGLLDVQLVDYARDSQSNRILPRAELDFASVVVERLLYFDSMIDVHPADRDPYGSRAGSLATSNTRTEGSYRLSPFLRYEASPLVTLVARHDEERSYSGSDELADRGFSRTELRAERLPLPYGGSFYLSTQRQRYSTDGADDWNLDALILKGDLLVEGDLVLGPLIGYERSTAFGERTTSTGLGAHIRWAPNERFQLGASVQHRFFGTGWELNVRHRTPQMSFQVQTSRAPVTSATVPRSRLSTFLDAILTTRYPEAAARSALVGSIISGGSLQNELATSNDTVASYPQVRSGARAAWVYLGSRNTVSVSAYRQTLRTLSRPQAAPDTLVPVDADNHQTGAAFEFNRKLTPQMSVDWISSWSRISGLADREGDISTEWSHRLTASRLMSMRTTISAGVQYRRLSSNVAGADSYSAADAFIGLNHRF